jgi:hypothetical protein
MKYFLLAAIVYVLIFSGCGKKEETKLEAFNAEAFAYDLGDSWEVNTTTRVKGFFQKEEGSSFTALLSYEIDLITPAGDTLKSIAKKTEDKTNDEQVSDVDLEAQFDLDSTYVKGNYKVIFNIKDMNTEQTVMTSAEFSLDNE